MNEHITKEVCSL